MICHDHDVESINDIVVKFENVQVILVFLSWIVHNFLKGQEMICPSLVKNMQIA